MLEAEPFDQQQFMARGIGTSIFDGELNLLFCAPACTQRCAGEPRPRIGPVAPHGRFGQAKLGGDLLVAHAHEIAQLDDLSVERVVSRQPVQGLVDGEHGLIGIVHGHGHTLQVHALPIAAPAQLVLAPRPVNEDPPHGLGGGGNEMRAIGEPGRFVPNQPEPGLVDERCRLQRLAGRFGSHFVRRQLPQLLIHQRQQFLGGLGVALRNRVQDARDLAHAALFTRRHVKGGVYNGYTGASRLARQCLDLTVLARVVPVPGSRFRRRQGALLKS